MEAGLDLDLHLYIIYRLYYNRSRSRWRTTYYVLLEKLVDLFVLVLYLPTQVHERHRHQKSTVHVLDSSVGSASLHVKYWQIYWWRAYLPRRSTAVRVDLLVDLDLVVDLPVPPVDLDLQHVPVDLIYAQVPPLQVLDSRVGRPTHLGGVLDLDLGYYYYQREALLDILL